MPVEVEVFDGMNGSDIMVEPTGQVWYMQIQNLCSETLEKAQDHETNAAVSEKNAQTYMQNAQNAYSQANLVKRAFRASAKQDCSQQDQHRGSGKGECTAEGKTGRCTRRLYRIG